MTLTTHAAIGAFIGSVVGDPVIGFMTGATSHFLVDMIPHGDNQLADLFRVSKRRKIPVAYVTIDGVIALLLVLTLSAADVGVSSVAFSAAVAGSILPDLLVGLADATKWKSLKRFSKFHFYFHDFFSRKHGDVKLKYALAGQAGFIVALVHLMSR